MTRNYGIDMLRLISMFFIVIFHVLGHGGVLENATGSSYAVSLFLKIVVFCAVNCYAIISGYVGYREEETKYHYAKYLKFWIPVFIYNVGITIIFYIIMPGSVDFKDIIKSSLPVTTYGYWYVNVYTVLFFLIPWINKLIRKITEKELNQLIFVFFILFSVYATFANLISDVFRLNGGFAFPWLVYLYVVGAWIKKNKISERLRVNTWFVIVIFCITITWGCKMIFPILGELFISYVSFTIVFIAIGLVAIFAQIQLKNRAIFVVRHFAPAAFGVYLIHDNHLVREFLIQDSFSWIANSNSWLIPIEVLGCASLIFIGCLLIEKFRLLLFELLKINRLITTVERGMDSMLNKCLNRIGGEE